MDYYSAMRRNEALTHAINTTRMNLENMLSERSQTQKVTFCMIPSIRNVQNRPIRGDRKQISSCQGLGCGRWGAGGREWLLMGTGMEVFWN